MRLVSFALLLLTMGLAPTAAAAKSPWSRATLPPGSAVVADGDRYAVVALGDGVLGIFDDRHPGGGFAPHAAPGGCDWAAPVLGGGRLAMSCAGATAAVLDLADGTWSTVAIGAHPALVSGVGRSWLRWTASEGRGSVSGFVHLATGASAPDDTERPDVRADLDADVVAQPLCGPVRRPRLTDGSDLGGPVTYEPAATDGRWVVSHRGRGGYYGEGSWERTELIAWRCGRPEPKILLEDCICPDAQFGAGVLTWTGKTAVQIRRLGKRVRAQRLPLPYAPRLLQTAHTRSYVFASSVLPPGPSGEYPLGLWSARMRPRGAS